MLEKIVHIVNQIVWSPALVVLLIVAALYFSIRTRLVQVRRLPLMVRSLFARRSASDRGISSFEAFCVALSGRVGTGNIVGVATAIAMGGPGSIFWMWVIAFFGASTAFVESTLAQIYRFHDGKIFRGGPFSYIKDGLKSPVFAVLFALMTILGYGLLLTTVQANGLSSATMNAYGMSPWISGAILAAVLALVIFGGARGISRVAAIVTPFMALAYILLSLMVIGFHIERIPEVLGAIVSGAFGIKPVAGGILGSTIMMGVKRGIFSNEAGQGGGAIVSGSADVPHPVRQGLAQAFSVYVDTLLVCTATALMILCSGTYNIIDANTGALLVENAPELGNNYVNFTQAAVDSVITGFGSQFVSIALLFFVFTTIMAYYFYSESALSYLFSLRRRRYPRLEKAVVNTFRILLLLAVLLGAVKEADVVWQMGDIGVGILAWINVIALLLLCPKAIAALNDYEKRTSSGDPSPRYNSDLPGWR